MPWMLCVCVKTSISFSVSVFFQWGCVVFGLPPFFFLFLLAEMSMNFNGWLYYRFWGVLFLHTDVIFTEKQMCQQQKIKGEKWHTFVFVLNPLALIECLMSSVWGRGDSICSWQPSRFQWEVGAGDPWRFLPANISVVLWVVNFSVSLCRTKRISIIDVPSFVLRSCNIFYCDVNAGLSQSWKQQREGLVFSQSCCLG